MTLKDFHHSYLSDLAEHVFWTIPILCLAITWNESTCPIPVEPLFLLWTSLISRVWRDLTLALKKVDHKLATAAKLKLEDCQRSRAKQRKEKGTAYQTFMFETHEDKSWTFKNLRWSVDQLWMVYAVFKHVTVMFWPCRPERHRQVLAKVTLFRWHQSFAIFGIQTQADRHTPHCNHK